MYIKKYLTVISTSIIACFIWICSAQAEQISSNDSVANNTGESTPVSQNGSEKTIPSTSNAENNDSFGNLVCIDISPELRAKIDQEFFRQTGKTSKQDKTITFKLKLHYLRKADQIITKLQSISAGKPSTEASSDCKTLRLTNYGQDTLILHGEKRFVDHVHRIVAAMDLPRPGINLEMYGIQVSSNNPDKMAQAMSEVRGEISKSQLLVQETYNTLQQFARTIEIDPQFKKLLEEDLGFEFLLDINRPLTLTDILILLSAAKDQSVAETMANKMSNKFRQKRFSQYSEALDDLDLCPFEGFFRSRGLKLKSDDISDSDNSQAEDKKCQWKQDEQDHKSKRTNNHIPVNSVAVRSGVADFALQYSDFINRPNNFDPDSLQQTSDILNTNLRATINIINRDIENMFMQPTLENIRWIVSDFNDVTYAQVGKSTIAGLSGLQSTVSGTVESNYDITPPLKLSELLSLTKMKKDEFDQILPGLISPINLGSSSQTQPEVPETGVTNGDTNSNPDIDPTTASAEKQSEDPSTPQASNISLVPTVGTIPLTTILGLAAAFETDRSQRLTLGYSGPNITVTPHILRNMSSAELDLNLIVGNPTETSPPIPPNSDQKKLEELVNL